MGGQTLVSRVTSGFRDWLARSTDARVRDAFFDMYENYGLSQQVEEILCIGSSDITIPSPDFPKTAQISGCLWISNNIPWYARNNKGVAFRAELREGGKEHKYRYLAMLWESTGKPKEYKVHYRTSDANFIPYGRRT